MPFTTGYRRGDIVLVSFPFTDLSSSKRRPALIISPDVFNEHGVDVVLVAIPSQEPEDKAIALAPDDFLEAALPKESFVRVAKIFTLHSTLIVKRVCALRPEKLDDVLRELRDFLC
jgi:mRNA interferase MazF